MKTVLAAILIVFLMIGVVWADEISDIIPYIIQVESGGDSNAVSEAGAVGLMQITSVVLEEFKQYQKNYNSKTIEEAILYVPQLAPHSIAELFIPEKNVWIGEWYLRRLRDHYMNGEIIAHVFNSKFSYEEHKLALILAAYNGGITRLRECNYDINKMPRETRRYVKDVMKLYKGD